MKQINKYILGHLENPKFSIYERLHINKDTGNSNYNYHPKTYKELKELVDKLIEERGDDADLNDIDTSEITDMSYMFNGSNFDGDISEWDVSNVKYMSYMLSNSSFTGENGDISNWDVSNVEDMDYMFYYSEFNGDISNWDVKKVKTMKDIFNLSPLEKNTPKWYAK